MTSLSHVRQAAGAMFLALAAASTPLSAQPDPTPPDLVERSGRWTFTGNCLDCLDRYNLDNPGNPLTEYLRVLLGRWLLSTRPAAAQTWSRLRAERP
jgi:hypothetical protein